MLQATKFKVKNDAKQNYFSMGNTEIFSCDLLKHVLLQSLEKITPCPQNLKALNCFRKKDP